jgi:hypothetical protein
MRLVKPIKPTIELIPGIAGGAAIIVTPDKYLNVTVHYVTVTILILCFQINITIFGIKIKN